MPIDSSQYVKKDRRRKKTTIDKGGRPPAVIDKEEFEKLCGLHCTLLEICSWFDVTDKTLEEYCKLVYNGKTFSEVYKKKSAKGKISLRRLQWTQAETSVPMSIWLGKQYLGQTDKIVAEVEEEEDDALTASIKERIGK